ncbi:InlB B-repeat-containing protein [Hominenteromicrobium mulieris]|uniref:InlB B-repeat-containing protein n=1 Tax=Hominenteromicrobium mulieris TaxID=2885357 RepID=UPI003D46D7C0
MKKRILSILLLCCMVLTLLPTTVLAADGPMDTIPKYDVSIDVYNRTSDISIKDSRSYYIYSSVPDKLRDTWAWDKKIFIQGDKAAPHVFIDGVNIKMSPSSKGPAIELNKKASAYLYFIGKDSTLQGADGRAAIQKNRSEGQLYVLARTGTTVTCKGGYRAAGIGGSWAIRNIGDSMFNMDMYGHGVNMHFGSQSNPDYWGGTINATGGEYGAGIGAGSWGHSGHSRNTIHGGAGERLYFYSGTVNASGGRLAAGIGGGFRGRGSHIYIYGGNIDAQGGDTGAGIGGGSWTTKQDMDGINAASDIVISGGRVSARGQYNCAGIGGGQYVPARNITITGGHVSATGHYGAAIGGGRWCHGKNITITDATLNLSTNYRSNGSDAAAVGYGDIVYKPEQLVADPSIATNDQIRIGSYKGKLVKLKLEARALSRDDEYSYFWNLYETLIPDENGLIDMQLLTLPYVQNYGWAINVLEMTVIDDPCNGNHDFGWVNRQSCHVWACRNKDCQARDPAAEMSKQNGKHIPGDWGIQEKHCAVCDHLLEKDTAAPVLEVLNDGESYTVEDVIVGRPGAYSFTVSDPAKSGEASSGVKSVTINGVEQKADSTYYSLPAPDGGNNDAGAEYTVVATDNAGNASTATVKIYRRHRVRVVSPDEQTTYAEAELAHNEYLVLTMKMPDGAAVRMTDKADHSEIPYDKEMGRFTVGLIDRSRTLVLEYNTEYPKAELILGRSQYFFGYNADTAEPHYLADVSKKTDKNVYSVAVQINADVIPSHYFSSPVCYTQEELAELDKQGKIAWEKYQHPEPEPGVWIVYIPTATIDIAEYDANGSWYVYAKAENLKGTTYVSTPKLIADVEKPKAINLSTDKELETDGEYWGDLRFRVEDALPVKVWHERYPGGNIELMTPDEDGCYTIPADYDVSLHHDICIEDACGNKTYYNDIDILWNYLEVVREKDYWDVQPAQPIRISREQDLQEELSKVNIGIFASDVTGFIPVDVSWEIPEDYDPQSPREQTFTVLGTVILEGTGARCVSGLDVITRPGEEWKKNFSISVTVEGAPRYKVTTEDSANGSVTVVNATETAENGTPLFYKDELVMLSIAPDEGYMLSTLSVNGTAAAVAVGEDAYTFAQPEENVTITATFEKRNEHTVMFDANGGSEPEDLPEEVTTAMPAKKVLHGSEYSLPECEFIAPEGKQFKAWEIGGTEYPVNAPVTVTADITVKAMWKDAPPAPAEYTVRFNANGGGGTMADVTGVSGSYTLPSCGFTEPEGKQFKGWSTSADGSVISGTTYEVSSDTTFYAIWESKEYSIIVTDGKATIGAGSEISKAAQGTTITLTANAAPDGKVFDKWVVESGNTTLEDANSETTTFIMPDSEVSVKATYTIPHTHTYDQEIQKPETLKSAADCTNDAVYFKSCSCGEISTTETFTAAGTQLGHAWASDWSKDTDNHWKECSRCHEKKDEAAHDYGSDNICDTCGYDKTVPHTHNLTLVPAKAPTCTEKGNTAYYTCDGCDKWFEDATGASEITDKTSVILAATGHSASDWKSDNTDHWKECTVVGCGVIIEGSKAAHTAGEWIIDTPATATTSGSKHKECTVCGYTMATETIPATGGGEHTHSYGSEWKNDADNHWHECSCGDKKDTAAHTAGEWIIDTPATATTDGSKHKECTVCGYTMATETIPATGGGEHTHSYGSEWKNDADNHWHECSCGDKKDTAAHTAGEWIIDTPATATTDGSKHKECTVCGYTMATETIPATGGGEHTHSYGSEWKNDADNHWHECSCGDKKDTAAHTAGEWIIDTPATATTDGSKHKECTVCGYTMTIETIPATGGGEHTHSYGSDWKNDATNHWHECSCGDKADKAAHDFKWVVDKEATATQKGSKHEECRVCGYKKAAVEIPATGTPTEPGKPTDSDSPQTGDNSNMILWIALLFVSGGVVIGITVYSKKKKENAE